jgi:pilus assembly protein CpaD
MTPRTSPGCVPAKWKPRRSELIGAKRALVAITCLAALLPGLGVAGPPGGVPPAGPTTENPKPLSITLLKLTHQVAFQGETIGIEGRQQTDLDAFLASSDARPGDPAYVESDGSPIGETRAANLAEQLTGRGFAAQVIKDATTPARELRVILERYVVTAPVCPDWSHVSWANFQNETSSNFGCATSADLAAMVADPRDLAVGRPLSSTPGEAASLPIERYRAGITPRLPSASTESGGGGGGGDTGGGGGGGGGGAGPGGA